MTTSSGWRTVTGAPEARAWLGLGTNQGDREANLRAALAALSGLGRIEAVSAVYQSEPVGYTEQPDFWNLVVRLATPLAPRPLLDEAHRIEDALGRTRPFPDAPRTMDIDLLLYDDVAVGEPALTVPHPRLRERGFVLRPLAEVDPELRHPVTRESILDLAGSPALERAEPLFPGALLLDSPTETNG